MFDTVSDKQIAIWGFAFKKDTNDTRESAAIYVCRDLLKERAHLRIYDPRVEAEKIKHDLYFLMSTRDGEISTENRNLIENNVEICDSPISAAEGTHAIAVMTEWDEFTDVDLTAVYQSMFKPAFLFDGRNLLDQENLREIGFDAHAIGKPAVIEA